MSFRRAAASFVAMAAFLLYNDVALADAPKVTARSAVAIEQGSRRVLFEKNARERLPMASTTKIMTALVALEKGNLNDVVQVSPEAAKVPGSSIYLKAGEELTLEQLLYGLMLQSGNDAATAIAQHIGGSAEGFLAMMNERAARLGLSDTHFASVCGLDAPGHYTSAYDLAVITAAAFDNADFRRIVATKSIYVPYDGLPNSRFLRNKNRILWSFEGANGVKTGYTGEEASALMDDAFAQYDMVPVVEPRVALGQVPTGEGISGAVRYGAPQKVALPLDGEERMRVCTHLGLCAKPEAPVADGQLLGEGRVILDGQVLATFPVVSLEADERKTYFWYVKRAIEEFIWRTSGEGNGCRSIWPPAESPRAGNARS
jgi:D-alanyl-D-alanine carboxypeptidase (penicillin-binding protein 5/6)